MPLLTLEEAMVIVRRAPWIDPRTVEDGVYGDVETFIRVLESGYFAAMYETQLYGALDEGSIRCWMESLNSQERWN